MFNGKQFEFKFEKKNGLFITGQLNTRNGNKEILVGKTWSW
jgi:hypothetical protein